MRTGATAGLLAVAALLAGCIAIPESGSVQTQPIPAEGDEEVLLPVPNGPSPGDSPTDIVRGFLLAGKGPQASYQVAREFLTDSFRSEWSPGAGTLVSAGALSPVEEATGQVSVDVAVTAELDASGHYTAEASGTSHRLEFTLEQDSRGEWRISNAPDGTVVTPAAFDLIFDPYPLYFFDPDYRYLVPDLRWFLLSRNVANRIVSELIAGGSELLSSGALVSAFPSGAALGGSPSVSEGRAVVPLDATVAAQSGTDQWRMLQQLTASLVSLGDVSEVAVTVGGLPLAIPDLGDPADRFLGVPPSAIGLSGGDFGVIGLDGVTPVDGIGTALDGTGAVAAAIGRDGASAAALTPAGVVRIADGRLDVLDARGGLAAPSLDPLGYTWTAPSDDASGLVALGSDGVAHAVRNELAGDVVALRVSRDGTRLLAALSAPDGPRLVIAGIERDADRAPTGLVAPVAIPVPSGQLIDAVWVDGLTIAVLTRDGEDALVTSITLGGAAQRLGVLDDAVQLSAGNGVDALRVRTSTGDVLRSTGDDWADTGFDASFLAVLD
ncbi:MAG: GerMN domain-containing protein [Actinomycetales bacterium]|nr:GerMN domain-containing protein [Actinomycetales bacterium]